MATVLDVRRSTRRRVVIVAAVVLAVGVLLTWMVTPHAAHMTDQPGTPANEAIGGHGWSADGCFLPGADIDDVPGLFDFHQACTHHAGCYQGLDRGGEPATVNRLRCDELFRTDLEASCAVVHGTSTSWRARECQSTAEAYYAVARSFGAAYYKGTGDPA